eukprot:6172388-Pleurochrysis_carterae.AAC.3
MFNFCQYANCNKSLTLYSSPRIPLEVPCRRLMCTRLMCGRRHYRNLNFFFHATQYRIVNTITNTAHVLATSSAYNLGSLSPQMPLAPVYTQCQRPVHWPVGSSGSAAGYFCSHCALESPCPQFVFMMHEREAAEGISILHTLKYEPETRLRREC